MVKYDWSAAGNGKEVEVEIVGACFEWRVVEREGSGAA